MFAARSREKREGLGDALISWCYSERVGCGLVHGYIRESRLPMGSSFYRGKFGDLSRQKFLSSSLDVVWFMVVYWDQDRPWVLRFIKENSVI